MRTLLAALAILATTASAAPQHHEPYTTLASPQPTPGDGKVEVVEFFWYGCEHCHRLEPAIDAWLPRAPRDVTFKRIPAIASGAWVAHAHLYYTLEAVGRIGDLHGRIFEAIHKQGLRLEQPAVRAKWLAEHDVDAARYAEAEKSFGVISKMKRAEDLTRAYRLEGVPMIVVQGRYTTSPHQAGGNEKMFAIVDQLIARERKR